MAKIKVLVELVVNANPLDDDEIKEAVYEKLTAALEAEELKYSLADDEVEDEEDTYQW